jgi:hypothetical protein
LAVFLKTNFLVSIAISGFQPQISLLLFVQRAFQVSGDEQFDKKPATEEVFGSG